MPDADRDRKLIAELEIRLRKRAEGGYPVDMRFRPAESDADNVLKPGCANLDPDELAVFDVDYGQELTKRLFADSVVSDNFTHARVAAEAAGAALRVRLLIDPDADELHAVFWERLVDPRDPAKALLLNQNVRFSRYLSSANWEPVRLRLKEKLKAIIAAAGPTEAIRGEPDPVDVLGEIERAKDALGREIVPSVIRGPETLHQLQNALRDEADILYLACHGTMHQGKAWLWLEGEPVGDGTRGRVRRVAGDDFVSLFNDLSPARRPRLVVLASCRSAGVGDGGQVEDGGVLAALGPRLAAAGIPAVIAMQGKVQVGTVERCLPTFFAELIHDGQIDRAMAAARWEVRDRLDFWSPALFLRLRGGSLWYEGFRGRGAPDADIAWNALFKRIEEGRCTPILGPGLLEDLIGPPHEIARRLAADHDFPLESYGRAELAHVAQFLGHLGMGSAVEYYRRHHFDEIMRRYRNRLPDPLRGARVAEIEQKFRPILEAVGDELRADEAEVNRILAGLPFAIYLTTNADERLARALGAADRAAMSATCPWRRDPLSAPADEPDPDHPLVYHLFGRFADGDDVPPVLTEDDHFDYLLGVATNRERIPAAVKKAMTDNLLLFLGFTIDHWCFRALFRSLTRLLPGGRNRGYSHVAVQINPEDGRFLDTERARAYLEDAFRVEGSSAKIYWGSSQDFIRELGDRWTRRRQMEGAGR